MASAAWAAVCRTRATNRPTAARSGSAQGGFELVGEQGAAHESERRGSGRLGQTGSADRQTTVGLVGEFGHGVHVQPVHRQRVAGIGARQFGPRVLRSLLTSTASWLDGRAGGPSGHRQSMR